MTAEGEIFEVKNELGIVVQRTLMVGDIPHVDRNIHNTRWWLMLDGQLGHMLRTFLSLVRDFISKVN